MIFQEALAALRNGEKIRHPVLEEGEYLMGCYIGLKFCSEPFEDIKKRGISMVKMKENKQTACQSIPIFCLTSNDWNIIL